MPDELTPLTPTLSQREREAVERAAQGKTLRLPRVPHRGRVGEVRAASVGSSMEMHDFRAYQPGDDVRHLDWNAVARTGELVVRVRQEEVSPRVEVLLDASRSMAVSPVKAERSTEVAMLLCKVAARQGLEPTVLVTSRSPRRATGGGCEAVLRALEHDAADHLLEALRRSPPLRPCGLRLVVSDFLFEAPLDQLAQRLSAQASALALIQVLDQEDTRPTGGEGARLVDAETGEVLERILASSVVESYQRRLAEHQQLLRTAAFRVRATLVTAPAQPSIDVLARGPLAPLWEGDR
ncbi:MAG: DUF58 domain-containing protein [Myxococcota bacterium]